MSVETPNEPAAQARRKAPRWMKIVLVLSLMLNVVGIGAVGARAWMVHKHGHGAYAMHALGVYSFLRKLPRERRKELREKFKTMRGELRRHGRSLAEPLKSLAGALSASEFDKSQLESAITALRTTHDMRAVAQEKFLLSFVDSLSPEERRVLGRKILKRIERREKWHRRFNN